MQEPENLWVYECTGQGPPGSDPEDASLAGVWPEPPYVYLFFTRPAPEVLDAWLRGRPGWRLTGSYQLDYRQWQQVPSREYGVGPFVIRSAKEAVLIPRGAGAPIPITIDPGLVFGSGLHPTTRGCLLALADLFQQESVKTAADLGTGTGILAIACALLGAERVAAIDFNPLAVRVARRNAILNRVEGRVKFLVAGGLAPLRGSFDLLVANIELPGLRTVLESQEWKGWRRAVIGGFLEHARGEVEALVSPGFQTVSARSIDGWPVLTLFRRHA